MIYRNPHTNEIYRGGPLKTKTGTIANPSEATLFKYGFEPHVPAPAPAPEPVPAADLRRMAYENEADCHLRAAIGYEFEGDLARAAEAKAAYLEAKAAIRARYPDSQEATHA